MNVPISTMFILLGLLLTPSHAVYSPNAPPRQPIAYPSTNQQIMISGSFLTDPIIQEAYTYVKTKVSASLLNIAPSRYRPEAPNSVRSLLILQPVYQASQTAANCYWPIGQCLRTADTPDYNAGSSKSTSNTSDIIRCPNNNEWGVSRPPVTPS
jgi:hypothetical protein